MHDTSLDLRGELTSLLVFLALVAAAAITGAQFEPGEWYEQLEKPAWTPPNWLFGPVWSALYIAIAVAGWRVWRLARPRWTPAVWLWCTQLVLNVLWSWLFFSLHRPLLALLDLLLLATSIAGFVVLAHAHSRLASWLFAPYLLWVLFAGALNLAIVLRN